MNRPVPWCVSASDQDRSVVVTRVAVPPRRAVLPWCGKPVRGAQRRATRRDADSKHGPCSQLLLRHS
ncbi:hypothetical protein C7C45_00225 [Micromonospora arborensis]|uniref:Uncharacterized protein n=1 Tax=Micromonospora arborensis TaxID=2116518 RepID=A0A318NQV1_9ACTN|nr:hypothetical protein C7C45_00225 [Micromonospora arborensis]